MKMNEKILFDDLRIKLKDMTAENSIEGVRAAIALSFLEQVRGKQINENLHVQMLKTVTNIMEGSTE